MTDATFINLRFQSRRILGKFRAYNSAIILQLYDQNTSHLLHWHNKLVTGYFKLGQSPFPKLFSISHTCLFILRVYLRANSGWKEIRSISMYTFGCLPLKYYPKSLCCLFEMEWVKYYIVGDISPPFWVHCTQRKVIQSCKRFFTVTTLVFFTRLRWTMSSISVTRQNVAPLFSQIGWIHQRDVHI